MASIDVEKVYTGIWHEDAIEADHLMVHQARKTAYYMFVMHYILCNLTMFLYLIESGTTNVLEQQWGHLWTLHP